MSDVKSSTRLAKNMKTLGIGKILAPKRRAKNPKLPHVKRRLPSPTYPPSSVTDLEQDPCPHSDKTFTDLCYL